MEPTVLLEGPAVCTSSMTGKEKVRQPSNQSTVSRDGSWELTHRSWTQANERAVTTTGIVDCACVRVMWRGDLLLHETQACLQRHRCQRQRNRWIYASALTEQWPGFAPWVRVLKISKAMILHKNLGSTTHCVVAFCRMQCTPHAWSKDLGFLYQDLGASSIVELAQEVEARKAELKEMGLYDDMSTWPFLGQDASVPFGSLRRVFVSPCSRERRCIQRHRNPKAIIIFAWLDECFCTTYRWFGWMLCLGELDKYLQVFTDPFVTWTSTHQTRMQGFVN